jgi:hypothetical protein
VSRPARYEPSAVESRPSAMEHERMTSGACVDDDEMRGGAREGAGQGGRREPSAMAQERMAGRAPGRVMVQAMMVW